MELASALVHRSFDLPCFTVVSQLAGNTAGTMASQGNTQIIQSNAAVDGGEADLFLAGFVSQSSGNLLRRPLKLDDHGPQLIVLG